MVSCILKEATEKTFVLFPSSTRDRHLVVHIQDEETNYFQLRKHRSTQEVSYCSIDPFALKLRKALRKAFWTLNWVSYNQQNYYSNYVSQKKSCGHETSQVPRTY